MSDYGIVLRGEEPNTYVYDSRKTKMTADLDPDLDHVAVVELDGGTILTGSSGTTINEVLWEMEHKMPFIPKVYGYIYVTDAPADRNCLAQVGTFQLNQLWLSSAFGYGSERIYVDADATKVYLRHQATSQSASFNGCGDLVDFRFRYIITNLPDIRYAV